MKSTYSSEVLARTKKYRENSYFHTPTNKDDDLRSTTKPLTSTMLITSPTSVLAGTITMEH